MNDFHMKISRFTVLWVFLKPCIAHAIRHLVYFLALKKLKSIRTFQSERTHRNLKCIQSYNALVYGASQYEFAVNWFIYAKCWIMDSGVQISWVVHTCKWLLKFSITLNSASLNINTWEKTKLISRANSSLKKLDINMYCMVSGLPTGRQLGHFALGPILLGALLFWKPHSVGPHTLSDKLLTF